MSPTTTCSLHPLGEALCPEFSILFAFNTLRSHRRACHLVGSGAQGLVRTGHLRRVIPLLEDSPCARSLARSRAVYVNVRPGTQFKPYYHSLLPVRYAQGLDLFAPTTRTGTVLARKPYAPGPSRSGRLFVDIPIGRTSAHILATCAPFGAIRGSSSAHQRSA
ncbi:hypothetical protein AURDEDRAFT_162611 [Auricularia subglabra TFB-10046 SS5]|nr:hypothetical protein AURDEDRAFT_162611 [Auricularia subglabra TFB-10046 SS5]